MFMLPRFRQLLPPSGPHSARQFNDWCEEADLGAWLERLPDSAFADLGKSVRTFMLYEHLCQQDRIIFKPPSAQRGLKLVAYRSSPVVVIENGHWQGLKCVGLDAFHVCDPSVDAVVACSKDGLMAALGAVSCHALFAPNFREAGAHIDMSDDMSNDCG